VQGATVLDFAYHVHTDIGNHMIGAKVNGKYVMASHQLANAEIVDILTYDGPLTRNLVARHQVYYKILWSSVQITVALPLPFPLPFPLPLPLAFPPPLCPSLSFAFPPPLCPLLQFAFPFALPLPQTLPHSLLLPPPSDGPFMYGPIAFAGALWHTISICALLMSPLESLPQSAYTASAPQVHLLQGIF